MEDLASFSIFYQTAPYTYVKRKRMTLRRNFQEFKLCGTLELCENLHLSKISHYTVFLAHVTLFRAVSFNKLMRGTTMYTTLMLAVIVLYHADDGKSASLVTAIQNSVQLALCHCMCCLN